MKLRNKLFRLDKESTNKAPWKIFPFIKIRLEILFRLNLVKVWGGQTFCSVPAEIYVKVQNIKVPQVQCRRESSSRISRRNNDHWWQQQFWTESPVNWRELCVKASKITEGPNTEQLLMCNGDRRDDCVLWSFLVRKADARRSKVIVSTPLIWVACANEDSLSVLLTGLKNRDETSSVSKYNLTMNWSEMRSWGWRPKSGRWGPRLFSGGQTRGDLVLLVIAAKSVSRCSSLSC